jgi:hypothetical protein
VPSTAIHRYREALPTIGFANTLTSDEQEGIAFPRPRRAYDPHRKQACLLSFAHCYLRTTSPSHTPCHPASHPSRDLTNTRTIRAIVEPAPDLRARCSSSGQFLRCSSSSALSPISFRTHSTLLKQRTLSILILLLQHLASCVAKSLDWAMIHQDHHHELWKWKWKVATSSEYTLYTPIVPPPTTTLFTMPPKSMNHLQPKPAEKLKTASVSAIKQSRRNNNITVSFPISKPNKTYPLYFPKPTFSTLPTCFTSLNVTDVDSAQPQLNILLQYIKKHANAYPIIPSPGNTDHYQFHLQAILAVFSNEPNTACTNRHHLQFICGRLSLSHPKLINPELTSTMKITFPNRTCNAYTACLMALGSNYDPSNQPKINNFFKSPLLQLTHPLPPSHPPHPLQQHPNKHPTLRP